MTDLTRVLRDLIAVLDRLSIDYAIMGGIAVRAYGLPRATFDVDVTISIDRTRLPTFYEAIEEAGYTVPETYLNGWVDQVAGMPLVKFRLYLEGRGIDVDVFLAESEYQKNLLERRRRHVAEKTDLWLISPEDLILLKLIAGRPRDIADVQDVLLAQGGLDSAYMRRWAEKLNIREALDRMLGEAGR
jgi:hypothetical protein